MSSIVPTPEALQKLAQAPETGKVVMLNAIHHFRDEGLERTELYAINPTPAR